MPQGMPGPIAFVQPRSIDEAIELLARYGEDARVVAGGTALSIMLRENLIHPTALIDLNGLPGLSSIDFTHGQLHLGALVKHRAVEQSAIVRTALPVLAQVFGVVANVRIRNAATLGGVLAEADYASDPPAVFLALDAAVEVTGPGGARHIPIEQFFRGFYETALSSDEIITGVRVPVLAPAAHAAYEKYVTRSSEDRPCIGAAAVVLMSKDGKTCEELRVAVGAAAETPRRFPEVEAIAKGTYLDGDVIRAVADAYAERIDTLADMRGSAWYRTEMIRVWVRRAILRARDLA